MENNAQRKERRDKRKALRLCIDCRDPMCDESSLYCFKHMIYYRNYRKRYHERTGK